MTKCANPKKMVFANRGLLRQRAPRNDKMPQSQKMVFANRGLLRQRTPRNDDFSDFVKALGIVIDDCLN
ncbi:MAG: hypothetical protein ACPL1K_02575, partial [Candidatus Kryptoniota bacterium]